MPVTPARGASGDDATPRPQAANDSAPFGRVALVIDDDEAAIDLMRRWLGKAGYSVISATDGERGLEIARAQRPSLIVLDIFMPGRSGYEILADIRSDPNIASTPVIVVTVDDNRALGLEAGATDVIVKPVVQDQLRAVLDVFQKSVSGEVLIVDDDEDAGDIIQRCAEQIGLGARRAYDGFQCLEMARERPPAAIVLDLAMPNLDGFQVMDELADDPALASVPVIVFSAREISSHEHDYIIQAGHTFCAKGSSSPRELAQNLKTALAGQDL